MEVCIASYVSLQGGIVSHLKVSVEWPMSIHEQGIKLEFSQIHTGPSRIEATYWGCNKSQLALPIYLYVLGTILFHYPLWIEVIAIIVIGRIQVILNK